MLMIPFIGLIVSLTLWGSFAPVPFTNINPHESFVGRLTGAVKTAYVATGAYEFVHTISMTTTSHYGHGVAEDPPVVNVNVTDSMLIPDSFWVGTQHVCELRIVKTVEPTRTASGGVGFDFTESPVMPFPGLVAFVIGALVLLVLQRMGLVPSGVSKLEELVEELDKLFEPAKVVYRLELVDHTAVTCSSVVAMVESSRALIEGGNAPYYFSSDASPFTDLAYRAPPKPCQAMVLYRPRVSPAVSGGLIFHPVVNESITSLFRLRTDAGAVGSDNDTTAGSDSTPDIATPPPTDEDPASEEADNFDSARLAQTKALVLYVPGDLIYRRVEAAIRYKTQAIAVAAALVCPPQQPEPASCETQPSAVVAPTPVVHCLPDQPVSPDCEKQPTVVADPTPEVHCLLEQTVPTSCEVQPTAVPDPTPVDNCPQDQQAPEASEVEAEPEAPQNAKKKSGRKGQKFRRAKYLAGLKDLKDQQADLIKKLEEESSAGPSPPSHPTPPLAPVPAVPIAPISNQVVVPAQPAARPSMTNRKQGKGRLSRPPNLPPPPRRQQPPPSAVPFVPGGRPLGERVQPPPASHFGQQQHAAAAPPPPASQATRPGRRETPFERTLYMHPNFQYRWPYI